MKLKLKTINLIISSILCLLILFVPLSISFTPGVSKDTFRLSNPSSWLSSNPKVYVNSSDSDELFYANDEDDQAAFNVEASEEEESDRTICLPSSAIKRALVKPREIIDFHSPSIPQISDLFPDEEYHNPFEEDPWYDPRFPDGKAILDLCKEKAAPEGDGDLQAQDGDLKVHDEEVILVNIDESNRGFIGPPFTPDEKVILLAEQQNGRNMSKKEFALEHERRKVQIYEHRIGPCLFRRNYLDWNEPEYPFSDDFFPEHKLDEARSGEKVTYFVQVNPVENSFGNGSTQIETLAPTTNSSDINFTSEEEASADNPGETEQREGIWRFMPKFVRKIFKKD